MLGRRGCGGDQHKQVWSGRCAEHPALLAEAVVQLASDPALRDEMGRAGRLLVEREYSWPSIVERWMGEIEHFASEPLPELDNQRSQ